MIGSSPLLQAVPNICMFSANLGTVATVHRQPYVKTDCSSNLGEICPFLRMTTTSWTATTTAALITQLTQLTQLGQPHYIKYTFVEGSLEVKLPTIWTDEKQRREEAEGKERLEERRVEEKD